MDVLGRAIQDHLATGKTETIGLQINGELDDPMDPAIFFRTYKEMPGLEKEALRLSKGKILDVGAAAGCHTLYLQEKGLDVTALEVSPLCCDVLTNRGVKKVVNADIMSFEGEKFDTILLLMNGFGMAQRLSRTPVLLAHLRTLLAPGGRIIGDSSDIVYTYEQEDGSTWIPADQYYGEVEFCLTYNGLEERFDWLYLDPDSLQVCAEQAGLRMSVRAEGPHFDYLAVLEEA